MVLTKPSSAKDVSSYLVSRESFILVSLSNKVNRHTAYAFGGRGECFQKHCVPAYQEKGSTQDDGIDSASSPR